MSASIGIKYFALVFEEPMTRDDSDWSEEAQKKFNAVATELDTIAARYGGKVAAVDTWGKIEHPDGE